MQFCRISAFFPETPYKTIEPYNRFRCARRRSRIPRPETYGVGQGLEPKTRKQFRSPAYMKTFIEENEIDSFEALKTVYNTAYNEYDKLGREEKKDKETLLHLTNLVEAYETFRPWMNPHTNI